ncbi:hypothetical protein ATANTOWER_017506 [Ataeniobius toweri]|uniref:Uncharacterized protein n=1 Tax=Ataeniobius toweri TaxID=208326 RepID=A0ABU7CK93_9TELE|nr:hypothetical protein [Ataeniobius toweri]
MFPPNMDLGDSRQESARDRWVQQQTEEAMKHLPADLKVLPSPLLLEQVEREAVQRPSPPSSLVARLHTAVKPSSSSRRKKRRSGAPSCVSACEESSMAAAVTSGAVVSQPADVRAAASNPASLSASARSPRLAAAPSMPFSLAPARCSEATPEELEERLRFYAHQLKSFRRTCLLYFSPELRERIRQMEEDYEMAVRQFYCRPPSPTPSHQSAAAEQSKPGLQNGAGAQPTSGLQGAAAVQPTSGLQSAAAVAQPSPGLQNKEATLSTPCLQNKAAALFTSCFQSAAIVQPKSASTSSS